MPVSPLRILTVCTANICRSPVAERVLQREFDRVGVAAVVRSAGTEGGKLDVAPEVVLAAREFGIDLSNHRSRLLTSEVVESADLIVTMTRRHLRAVVELDSSAWPVTFTLKEMARRSQRLAPASLSAAKWIEELSKGRNAYDLLGSCSDDDLADPYGGPYEGYRSMVADVNRLGKIDVVVKDRRSGQSAD